MDVSDDLTAPNPQKAYLKFWCKWVYWMGLGDCWHEKTVRSKTQKVLYAIWAVFMNSFLILNTVNEICAYFRNDLTVKERNDLLQMALAHPSLVAKYSFLIQQRERIKELFVKLIEERGPYRKIEIDKKSVKDSVIYGVTFCTVTYGTLFFSCIDAFTLYMTEGVPYHTEVTLLPSHSSTGFFAYFGRFLVELHWWVLVHSMVLVDNLAITSLVILGYKFKIICMYFDGLRIKVLKMIEEKKTDKEIREVYEKDFVIGVKMHLDALWCSQKLQLSLGSIYGVQILESSILLVICLIKLVTLERNMTFLLANSFYMACLLILNGSYMMAAGDVTYEAARLPTSIFHSGWELVRTSKKFHSHAVLAIALSQKPVFMTAFGVILLTHHNFITVIRSSYSFFAVMY